MGFFNRLKHALGFNEQGDELDDVLDRDVASQPYINPYHPEAPARQAVTAPAPATQPATEAAKEPAPATQAVEQHREATAETTTATAAAPAATQAEPQCDVTIQEALDTLVLAIKGTPLVVNDNSEELASLGKRLQEAQSRFATEQQRANDLSTRLTAMQEQVLALQSERDNLATQCRSLQARATGNTTQNKEIAALRQVIDQLTADKQALEQTGAETERKLDESIEQIKQLNEQITDANRRLAEADDAINNANEARAEAQAAREQVRLQGENLAAALQQTATTMSQLKQAEQDLEQSRAESKQRQARIDELERQLARDNTLREQRDIQLANQIDDLSRRLKRRNTDVADLEQQLAAAQQVAREAEATAARAVQDTNRAKAQLDQTEQRLAAAIQERDDLAASLEFNDPEPEPVIEPPRKKKRKKRPSEPAIESTAPSKPQPEIPSKPEPTPSKPKPATDTPADDNGLLIDVDFELPEAPARQVPGGTAVEKPATGKKPVVAKKPAAVEVPEPAFDDLDWLVPAPPSPPRAEEPLEFEIPPIEKHNNNDPRQLSLF